MAKKGKLVRSASSKAQFVAYALQCRFEKNKVDKVLRAAENQPNNKQLLDIKPKYKYTRNRKSRGHVCKGAYSSLGFVKNMPTELMLKGHAPLHLYNAGSVLFDFNTPTPHHGRSMRTQLEELGYKYVKRKYKKTTR